MAQAKTHEKKISVRTKTGGTTAKVGNNGKGAMLGYGAKGRR